MTLFHQYMENPAFARLMAQEELIMEVTESLCELLEKAGVSRQELAKRLGKSKGFVSQLLNGGRNLTLRTLADVVQALGYKISLGFAPRTGFAPLNRPVLYAAETEEDLKGNP